ncbi:MAG: hypothetical protein ACM33T_15250 [Solirubrobacterales bacterium]
MKADVRARVLARLRALMARTVANGASDEEELVAARMVGKTVAQLDAMGGIAPAVPKPQQSWAKTERDSREYQQLLEKNTLESLLKAAVQELGLEHINTVSPPRKRVPGLPVERVGTRELLEPHLAMMLAPRSAQLTREILGRTIDELIYDGAFPPYLDIPIGE